MFLKYKLIIVTLFIIDEIFCQLRESGELQSLIVLYRHGDRSPTKLYPKDPYNNASLYWPEGLGELTNIGLQHQYELGIWLRKRYGGFLPETFSPNDIYVRSTDSDRTLMSAAANLAGLYPPKNVQIWNQNLLWRPTPIHTVPHQDDSVLAMTKDCPKYDLLYEELLNSTFFKNIDDANKDLYRSLSENTGWNITSIREIETIYSILSIEKQYNLTLPSWTRGIFPEKLEYLSALKHATYTFTKELARLKNGPFFDNLFSHFDTIINKTNSLKFLMLSAHDGTIVNVLSAMNLYNYNCPDFTATIIWELRKKDDKYYVNIFYKNNSTLSELQLSDCDLDCNYDEFKNYMTPFTLSLENWEKECSM